MSRFLAGDTISDQTSPEPDRLEDFRQKQILFLRGELSEAPLWKPAVQRSQEPQTSFPPARSNVWYSYRDPTRRPSCQDSWSPFPQKPSYSAACPEGGVDQLVSNFQGLTLNTQGVERHLLEILRDLKSGQTACQLASRLRLQTKVVNHHLYKLRHQGRLSRSETTPPLWRLEDVRDCLEASREGRPASQEKDCSHLLDLGTEEDDKGSSASDQEDSVGLPDMAEVKEKICSFLFGVTDSTALNLAKNIGLTKARDVNATLLALEKLGEVHKENASPPRWSLTDNKRKRMQVKVKVEEVRQAVPPESEPPALCLEPEAPTEVPSPRPSPPPPPLLENEEKKIENGQQAAEPIEPSGGGGACPPWWSPSCKRSRYRRFSPYDLFESSHWATDDIPEDLNAISTQDESRYVMESPLYPSYTTQLDTAFQCTPLEKLVACQKKNPVSGLIEYTQYMYQHCEFVLLKQSGPSHEPRFKFQAKIDTRHFPPAEAGSKKLAKQEAAAIAMKILLHEAQNEGEDSMKLETTPDEDNTPKEEEEEEEAVPEQAYPGLSPAVPQLNFLCGKNPISALMEYAQKVGSVCEFKMLSQEGPPHDPKFRYCVKLGERVFPAVAANSKKGAKQTAAEVAMKGLMGDPAYTPVPISLCPTLQVEAPSEPILDVQGSQLANPEESKTVSAKGVGELIKYLNSNPVSGLLEYARANGFAAEFKLINQTGPPHDPKFVFQAKVGGRWFPSVTAHSKKQGKQEAADAALRVLIGENEKAEHAAEGLGTTELPVSGSTLHDQIAMLSHQRFNALTARIQHSLLGRKILAAIIMRKGQDGLGVVVSIGTGKGQRFIVA
ncbi:double-stranded RNA-specific adenosine deaminase-like isoform X1 [Pseudonaja textilis]|uniref:double-stranded RNA-specific adenosine deaminase-like isoform X1 n=1 Tax=Pseudonaja textilis TaxID=8673 RepID=UPI000EAA30B8|nr:double-stranded RNA-specific adenosine deaminase-like isoform X1 [Pseudonaja textilis]XP_026580131.1 double-stranded RNA-specific adenosine deaminase-like isoform X1 [Pseudonaja textilis]XP_026580133.1 double-stranded RNA-specific adenosine deaminase-like isoform X1 [Pseudonaja textilis]XP_026580135.1 double-stranded RNA-specific adenosine deaminase-like isoform X1 [Pseudonaja textilis]XP_026580136.1 double-stranded RNA-specific adenosine deaminase-like isoform X1 [Pseudonaja textilis]XP_02